MLSVTPPALRAQSLRPAPGVNASSASWYRGGDPIPIGDAWYYPSGPSVFFDSKIMTVIGFFRGIPIYTDTTREPFSFVLVPVGGGQMRPYERRRSDDFAGLTGHGVPARPVATTGSVRSAAGGGRDAFEKDDAGTGDEPRLSRAIPAAERPASTYTPGHVVVTIRRPESNDGIWVSFAGARWVARGPAISLDHTRFASIGTYVGFPVFAPLGVRQPRVIFLPGRNGLIAPYRRR